MNKRIFAALLSLMTLLCGCSLAQPERTTPDNAPDLLVGAFITIEYLDLFDIEAWLQDNADSLSAGDGPALVDGDAYQGRIYAELVETSFTDEKGVAHTDKRYRFKGLDGILLAYFRMQDESGSAYWSGEITGDILDVQTSIKDMDGECAIDLSGTIYLSTASEPVVFYLNPIYQTADGKVYVVPGQGLQFDSTLGCRASEAISGTTTVTEDGEKRTFSARVEVKFDCVELPQKLVLIQMDANNTEIGRTEFTPGEMPEEFTPMDSTAYLIVEEHCADGIHRSLHQSGYPSIAVSRASDGALCTRSYTTVKWAQ